MPESSGSVPLAIIADSLRRERQRAGISLGELARRAGIAKSTLSQLETARGNPSVETLWALCVALEIPFSALVAPPAPKVRVIRAGEGDVVRSEQVDFAATLLSSCPPHARRDIYVLAIEPGPAREAEPHTTGTVEHLIVNAGRLRAGPADDPVELGPGDYASFPGDVAHLYRALRSTVHATLIMEHR